MNHIIKVWTPHQNYYVENKIDGDIKENKFVVIQTPKGLEFGKVERMFHVNAKMEERAQSYVLMRQATEKDFAQVERNENQKKMLKGVFQKTTKALNLEMQFVDIHISHDRDRVTFFYMADGRIDFRELVKKLASVTKSRVELRQVNERERAKRIGGVGPCGYELCCSHFLQEFGTVNVKMAKMQQLSFNLQRVTGLCDRLLCCLKYEHEQYIEMKKELPDLNRRITLDDGSAAKVRGLQLIDAKITLQYEDMSIETLDFQTFFTIYTQPEKKEEVVNERSH